MSTKVQDLTNNIKTLESIIASNTVPENEKKSVEEMLKKFKDELQQEEQKLSPLQSVQKHHPFDKVHAKEVISELYQFIVGDIMHADHVDIDEFKRLVSQGLEFNASCAALLLFYLADYRGLNKPEFIASIIPLIATSEFIGTSFRVKFIHGLIKMNRWKLALMFFDQPNNSVMRQEILSQVRRGIISQDVSCMREMPRQGTIANRLRGYIHLSPKEWRKTLAKNCRFTLPSMMSGHRWFKIDYAKLPIGSLAKFFNAFKRNDEERFSRYLEDNKERNDAIHQFMACGGELSPTQDIKEIVTTYRRLLPKPAKKEKRPHGFTNKRSPRYNNRTGRTSKPYYKKDSFHQRKF